MSRSETHQLEQSLTEIYNREKEYEEACIADAEAEHIYKVKNATKFLEGEGTVDARKAQALVDCAKEHKAYLMANAVRDFTKEKLRDSQQALSARQSLLTASVRSDLGYAVDRRN